MNSRANPDCGWGWRPGRDEGIWRYGCPWLKPFAAAAPWVTLALMVLMFHLLDGRLAARTGVAFDLPAVSGEQVDEAGLALFAIPADGNDGGESTLVFFDDARYQLADAISAETLRQHLNARMAETSSTLVIFADRKVSAGVLMHLVGLAREAGVARVQIAEKGK